MKNLVFSLVLITTLWKCGSNEDIYKILQENKSSDWGSYLIIYFIIIKKYNYQ